MTRDMFSTQEAVSFLQTSWGVQDVKQRFHDNHERKRLLEDIVQLVQRKVPYQNITLLATPAQDRRRPHLNTIKHNCMAGIGGLCYELNVFTWGLLKGLGFAARLSYAPCTVYLNSPGYHIIVLVSDLEKPGDLHLVDCGNWFPTFRAIPLDFEKESPVYVASFLEYKYIRHEGKILRMHGEGDRFKHNDPPFKPVDYIVGKWRRYYHFSLNSSERLSDFDEIFDEGYTVPHTYPFNDILIAIIFPDLRTVSLTRHTLKIENEKGQMETTILEGDEAIVDAVCKYFPSIKEETVRKAILFLKKSKY